MWHDTALALECTGHRPADSRRDIRIVSKVRCPQNRVLERISRGKTPERCFTAVNGIAGATDVFFAFGAILIARWAGWSVRG